MRDYISREAAIRAHCDGCVDDGYCGKLDGRYACEDVPAIMAIPAADVRPVVRGAWKPNPRNPYWLDCTVCGYGKPERTVYNFCPCCGADMRK